MLRLLQQSDLCWLRKVVQDHPDWSRHKITKHICTKWEWHTHSGQLKTFAARSMIDKLEQRDLLELPPIRVSYRRQARPPFPKGFIVSRQKVIGKSIEEITSFSIYIPTPNSYEENCVGHYLSRHHYLGFNRTVGENIKHQGSDPNDTYFRIHYRLISRKTYTF